jgi:hypothetical protein
MGEINDRDPGSAHLEDSPDHTGELVSSPVVRQEIDGGR